MWNDARLLNAAAALMLAAALLMLGWAGARWILHRKTFDLRGVTVIAADGSALRHVNLVTVRAVALPELKGNLFEIDLAAARRAFEAMPWVRHATVARRWPDRLVVEIEEHVPFAVWSDGRGVNTFDELFAVNGAELDQYGDLPNLDGPIGTERRVAQRFRQLRSWLAPLALEPVAVELSSRFAWRADLAGNNGRAVAIEFGREQSDATLEQRAQRLVSAWKPMLARFGRLPNAIDLRYANGFAVRVADMKFLPAAKPAAAAAAH